MSDYKQITSNLFKALEKLFSLIYMNIGLSYFSYELCIMYTMSGEQERDGGMERHMQAEKIMNLKVFGLLMSHCLLTGLLGQFLACYQN